MNPDEDTATAAFEYFATDESRESLIATLARTISSSNIESEWVEIIIRNVDESVAFVAKDRSSLPATVYWIAFRVKNVFAMIGVMGNGVDDISSRKLLNSAVYFSSLVTGKLEQPR